MIPNIIHFNFGMSSNFGGKPFSLIHYLAIKSAIEINNPDSVFIWYFFEDDNIWWQRAKKLANAVKIDIPTSIFSRPLKHPAHRSDIVRLKKLKEYGGIYLDADVICIRPFAPLLEHSCVFGKQGTRGICNATMLAEPNNKFIIDWIDSYKTFRGKGTGKYWDEHSVIIPARMISAYSDVTLLGPDAFFYPLWGDINIFFFEDKNLTEKSYSVHLWEQMTWSTISNFSIDYLKNHESEFCKIVSPYISELSNGN